MDRRQCLGALGALSVAGCATTRAPSLPAGLEAGKQKPFVIEDSPASPIGLMWVSLPAGYAEAREPWPLLIFLHGSGERGSDLNKVLMHGPPKHAAAVRAYPMVVVSPQLGEGRRWEPAELHALLGELQSRFNVDRQRSYCTGLSLGGHGTWNWASSYPGDLAAVAPVCGYGDPAQVAANMKNIPVRAYHGDQDKAVPIEKQQACVDALRAAGGDVSFTVYPGVGHNSWDQAYEDPGLVPWLLSKKLA